jgi:transmembrane sensor
MNNNEENNKNWETIASMLSGEADEKTAETFEQELDQNENLREDYESSKEQWTAVNEVVVKEHMDVEKAWDRQKSRVVEHENRLNSNSFNISNLFKIAAVLVVAVMISVFYLQMASSNVVTISTGSFEEEKVELSDGSTVFLNANSSLSYAKDFKGKIRNVQMKGEAFFEVARDEQRPFIVGFDGGLVEVLGTSFNINESNEEVNVFVRDGRVKYSRNEASAGDKILVKGDLLTDNFEHIITRKNKDVNLISWQTDQVTFAETNLPDVFDILSATYKQRIVYSQQEIADCRLTGEYNNLPIDEVLTSICAIFNLEISTDQGKNIISGNGCQ